MTKKFTCKLIVVFMAMLCSSQLYSTTYYVSSTGTSSGTGTLSSPLRFSTAISKSLTAGDSLILRGGMYSFTSTQTISQSGTASKYLTIMAYSGETPIFDFRGQAYSSSNPGVKLNGNYVHIKGVIIQGAGDNGMIVSGSNNYVELCVFRWNCDSGLQMKAGSDNLILNCDSYENFDYKTGGTSSPNYGGNADGFADKQYTNTGTNTYKGCRSWMNADDGWDSYEKVGNTVYDSCWCYAMGPSSYDMTDHIRFKTDSASWFYQFKNAAGRYVVTNYGNGNGFKLGGNYTANNTTLSFCLSASNTVKGFDQNNNKGAMILYNCTSYKNGTNYGFSNTSYGTLVIKNCASLTTTNSNSFRTTSYTHSNNSWDTGFSCSSSDFQSLDYTQMLNDRQTDGSLPEISFMHQTSSSAMIDKGTNVGLAYLGTAPDLGAFEYNSLSGIASPINNNIPIFYSSENKQIIVSTPDVIDNLLVYTISGQFICNSTENTIDASSLKTGVYFVKAKCKNNRETFTKKIMVY